MTLKRIQIMKSLAFYIFITGVILITLIGLSHDFALAQDEPKVGVFEFSLVSSDTEDKSLKESLETKIRDKLQQLLKIDKPKLISDDSLLPHLSEEDYIKQMGIRYTINVHMESLPEEKMKIQISLKDMESEDNDKKVGTWGDTFKKDLRVLEDWFESVSKDISLVIRDNPRERVLINKFNTVNIMRNSNAEEKHKLKRLGKGLHKKLKVKLSSHWEKEYELKSFGEGSSSDIDTLNCEYVISGDLRGLHQLFQVVVDVEITKDGREGEECLSKYAHPPKPFEGIKGSPGFIKNLAEYIVFCWPEMLENW